MRFAALLAAIWFAGAGIAAAQSPLIDAVKANDVTAVRALLDKRADVNTVQPDGTTALHWAVEQDAVEIVPLLIRAGANVKATNRYGATPLWLASLNGNATTIEMLLEAGADPSAASDEGETALMVAARTGKIEAVNRLLARGADPNVKEQWRGQTALMWAAVEGHAPVIDALVARGADVKARSNGGFTAILFAAREGQIAAVDALIKAGADMNDWLPIRRRQPQNASAPVPPDMGPNVFLLAAANAYYELAAWLLDRGADPNAAPQGFTALHQVSWVRKAGIAGSNNPAPQGSGTMDSLSFVRKLVAKGATLDGRATKKPNMGVTTLNSIGATPFLLAARTADAPLMKLLAELGANPLLTNEDGSTPLMVAAGLGTNAPGEDPGTEPEVLDAVKVALGLGNDPNAVDKNGETAMHGAAYKHVPTVVQYLADKGARADVWNRPNSKGWTPLKIAEGIQRGMNIVSSPDTATALRQILATRTPAAQ